MVLVCRGSPVHELDLRADSVAELAVLLCNPASLFVLQLAKLSAVHVGAAWNLELNGCEHCVEGV